MKLLKNKDYESLVDAIELLHEEARNARREAAEERQRIREELYDMMENYFKEKCVTSIIKHNKEYTIAELKRAVDKYQQVILEDS